MDWNRLVFFDHNEKIPLTPLSRGIHIPASFKHELRNKILRYKYQVEGLFGRLPPAIQRDRHLQGGRVYPAELREGIFKKIK